MPTIEISYRDLCNLVGKELSKECIEEILPDLKCEIDEIDNDTIIVEVTADRMDLLSVEGIARSVRNYLGIRRDYKLEKSNIILKNEGVKIRPYIVYGIAENLKINKTVFKSLIQLQEKIHETYGRKRKKIAIGLHDLDKVKAPFTYKEVRPDEISFIPLGMKEEMNLEDILKRHEKGREYGHILKNFNKYPVIVDSRKEVLSFPPIINGSLTEVKLNTRNIFVDVTGTSYEDVKTALNVILTSLCDRGGKIKSVRIIEKNKEIITPDFSGKEFTLSPEQIMSIIGIDLNVDEIRKSLERMDYKVKIKNNSLRVITPFYRSDFLSEIDVIEDVVIGIGFNRVDRVLPNLSTIGEEDELERFADKVRELLIGFNYIEVSNPVLSNEEILIKNMKINEGNLIKIKNPVSEKYTCVRNSLIPQLLEFLSRNTKEEYPQKIFEISDVVVGNDKLPEKSETLKFASGITSMNYIDFNNIKGEIEGLFEILNVECKFVSSYKPYCIKGRHATIKIEGQEIGEIGEIHPEVLENFKISIPCVFFELNLSKIHQIISS